MKFLLWLGIGVLLVMWLMRDKKAPAAPRRQSGAGDPDSVESMLQCAHCGTYVPASEAVRNPAGAVFCSDAHRLLHSSH